MFNYFFLAILLILPNFAFAQNCPNSQAHFNVNIIMKPVTYENNHNIQYISSLLTNKNSSFIQLNPGFYTVGLTKPNKSANITYRMQPGLTTINNEKMFCAKIVSLDFTLTVDTKVYLASELQGLPCSYNNILNHENTHVAIEKNSLDQLRKDIGPLLLSKFDSVIYAKTHQQLYDIYEQHRLELISTVYQSLKDYTEPLHAVLDNKENYLKESLVCSVSESQELYKRKSFSIYK